MGIEKIFNVYEEYLGLKDKLSQSSCNFTLEETEEIIEIQVTQDFSLSLIEELLNLEDNFEVFCNPFSYASEDVVDEIKRGIHTIDEVDDITISYDKTALYSEITFLDIIMFDRSSLINVIKSKRKTHNYKLNIGIIDTGNLETELVKIIGLNNDMDVTSIKKDFIDEETKQNLDFYLSNNKNSSQTYYYNPFTFLIKPNSQLTESNFIKLLKSEFYLMLLEALSFKKIDQRFILRGDKSVSVKIMTPFETSNYDKFVEVFLFLVSEQKYTEKFIITKKVFSLYINDNENISTLDEKLPEIWKTINHYYDHYIEDNIKEFFKTKDQLLKEAMNVSKVIFEQTDKINNSIIASILSIIILVITTVYNSLEEINFVYATLIVVVFLLFSIIYYSLMKSSSYKRYELSILQFSHFINEVTLIQKSEKDAIETTYINKPYIVLKHTLNKLLLILIIINILLLFFYFVYLCIEYNVCIF